MGSNSQPQPLLIGDTLDCRYLLHIEVAIERVDLNGGYLTKGQKVV